jgi:phage FluMu gp28-like protein
MHIVKQTEEDLEAFVGTEWGFISALCRADGAPITPEPYQLAFWRNRARLRWVVKGRQVGFSFAIALEALARCHLRDGYTAVIISYNLADATEKILVARQVYEELPRAFQKKLVTDAKTELAFESNRPTRALSRIISVPSKPPRGKHGDLFLDELAHYTSDRTVYTGSTALILRSPTAQLTGCSTPLGRRGVFWEIATEEIRRYPGHSRQVVPWWLSRFMCRDVKRAALDAPAMATADRVAAFGRANIKEQFESLPLDNFIEEFECAFLSESDDSPFPYELILPCTSDELRLADDVADLPAPRGRLVAGFDVGRLRDKAALAVFDVVEGRHHCRMLRTFTNVPFDAQEGELRRLLTIAPIARLSIDQTGIGMHLAENLARDFPQVEPEWSTNPAKEIWVTDLKLLFQRRDIALPKDRKLVGEIHSIKKRVLPSGKVSYDAERTAAGHADRFWAIALACHKERGPEPRRRAEVGVRVIG